MEPDDELQGLNSDIPPMERTPEEKEELKKLRRDMRAEAKARDKERRNKRFNKRIRGSEVDYIWK